MTRQRRWDRNERGAATAVTVLVFPALLVVIMVIVQFVLYAHATSVAEASAQEGVAVARRADGTKAGAEAAAGNSLASLGPRMLTTHKITATRSTTQASVTITGKVVSLVPGVRWTIRETATGPVERYVPQDQP